MTGQRVSRDEGNWAKPVDRLAASNVPDGALDTVGGKQVVYVGFRSGMHTAFAPVRRLRRSAR